MQYSEIKTTFTGILNRRDITPTQINTFLNLGLQYVQRKLRVPPMEKTMAFTCDGNRLIPIPGDFLEAIALFTDDTVSVNKLEKRDLQTVLRASHNPGSATMYHRYGSNFMVAPVPAAGIVLYVNYYADATALSADTDHNWITDAMPSVLVYAALMYAADFFLDDRKTAFSQTLIEDMSDVQEMANRDELTNGTMSPVLNMDGYAQ